jgi:hypothetical protein
MTFLNPFVLFGLAAAGIPILLHLLNLRRLKTIEFSTLSFLKELQKTSIRRVKIRQWLLLTLRTLLVALLVVAFSRPTLKGTLSSAFAERAKTTAVILLDDSPSMTRTSEHRTLFAQAQSAALHVLDAMNEGDEVYILPLSTVVFHRADAMLADRDFSVARKAIGELKPSYAHASFEEVLRVAAKLLSQSKNFNKEVYIVSDDQRSQWESTGASMAENLFPSDVHFFVAKLKTDESQNAGLEEVRLPGAFYESNKPFTVEYSVRQTGESLQAPVASIFLNGVRSAQTVSPKVINGRARGGVVVVPKASGIVRGVVAVEDDDIEFDNKRYFAINIPRQIRVLIVGEHDELSFVRVALLLREHEGGFDITETVPSRLTASQIASSDVLLLCGIDHLSDAIANRLKTFLESGRGILVLPDSRADSLKFSGTIAAALRIPAVAGVETVGPTANAVIVFESYDTHHPLFSGVFSDEQMGQRATSSSRSSLESPTISKTIRFAQPKNAIPLISLSIGSPFLQEIRSEAGPVLVFSVAPHRSWSDWPQKTVFAPILNRAVQYLAAAQSVAHSSTIGEEVVLKLPQNSDPTVVVRRPNGTSLLAHVGTVGAGRTLTFSQATEPGIYLVTSQFQRDTIAAFVVNVDARELDTQSAEQKTKDRVLKRLGISQSAIRTIDQPERAKEIVLESRLGTELWKFFLAAALATALLEMFVARESSNKRGAT